MRILFLIFSKIAILSFLFLVSPAIAEITIEQLYERAYATQINDLPTWSWAPDKIPQQIDPQIH